MPSIATPTNFLSVLILNSQSVGVAIEVIDIWYIGVICFAVYLIFRSITSVHRSISAIKDIKLPSAIQTRAPSGEIVFPDFSSISVIFPLDTQNLVIISITKPI